MTKVRGKEAKVQKTTKATKASATKASATKASATKASATKASTTKASTTKPSATKATDILEPLVRAASSVRHRAYAPYSKFQVGAALLTKSGHVFVGCNVENASYPVGICAERSALAAMIAAGESKPVALAVVTPGKRGGSPCGMCRQALIELARDMPIALVGVEGFRATRRDTTLSALLPDVFDFEPKHDPRKKKPGRS